MKAFFVDLARRGKEKWNKWWRERANECKRVTFEGVDFSQWPGMEINFSGFEFGDDADFSRCKWWGYHSFGSPSAFVPGGACFTGAVFGESANFRSSDFGAYANFTGAVFGREANFTFTSFGHSSNFTSAKFGHFADFTGAAFGEGAQFLGTSFETSAKFTGATFGDRVVFSSAAFGDRAYFTGTAFGCWAIFWAATFGNEASFIGAVFGHQAEFSRAAFGDRTYFIGASFGWDAKFEDVISKGWIEFTGRSEEQLTKEFNAWSSRQGMDARRALERQRKEYWKFWKRYDAGPGRFSKTSFGRARFYGGADFSGREFEQIVDFTNACLYSPPDFDNAKYLHRIDFTGAYIGFSPPGKFFHWTKDGRIPVRLRAIRKIAEETKNHDLERDLYIEERKAERGVIWRQFLDELERAPKELQTKLDEITNQKKHAWLEWRLKVRARITHLLGIFAISARLIGHVFWILVMLFYWSLSNYGRSFLLPLGWLGLSGYLFYQLYLWLLSPMTAKAETSDIDKYIHAVQMLAFGNAVPFVGPLTIDADVKKFLFCLHDKDCLVIPPHGYQWMVVGQNLLSITLVFFIGLALRNYFKIK